MISIVLAVILDWIIGDPYNMPHPVRLMGRIINYEEKVARNFADDDEELFLSGLILALVNILLGLFPLFLISKMLRGIPLIIFETVIYYYCISARMLHYEAVEVRKALRRSLEEGRERLQYIVGRDTRNLSEEEAIKATIETVSENTSDGIIAPLFYIFLLGPAGGITYKFINTMDSMIGYNNEKYGELGKGAAIIDDIVNYIPARLTGLLMCLSEFNFEKIKRAYQIMKKDHKNHTSPNAGYPEAATAGILGIELGGGSFYNGVYVDKPTIGIKTRVVRLKDIDRTVRIMYKTELLFVFIIFILTIL